MSERHTFYISPAEFGTSMHLAGPEHKHLAQVLRLKPGDMVTILDGMGRSAQCRIEATGKRETLLTALEVAETPRMKSLAVVALALSKATRRGFFLEKATELGASEVWLWQGDHSQGKLPPAERESWQAKMIAGIKQCQNPWLPAVKAFGEGIDGVIAQAVSFEHHLLPWEKQEGVPLLGPDNTGLPGTTIYVIGPEGGFSERELAAMKEAGYMPVSLGQRILRCETAATLCLGLHWWASQQPGHPDALVPCKARG